MMKYVPEVCSEGKLEGHIMVVAPTRKQKLALARELERMEGDDFDKLEVVEAKLSEHIKEVAIRNVEADVLHESLDDMGMDPECDALFTELQTKLVQGFPLGKN